MGGEKKNGSLPQWFLTVVIGRKPKWTLVRLAVLLVATWVVFNYVLTRPIRVTGISMEPTYHDGQINIINRLAYLRHEPERGDVVGVSLAGDHALYLKRIVGLPGETVAFVSGKLYINDEPVDEPYVRSQWDWNMPPRRLGFNEYYVVGDNRGMPMVDHTQGVALRNKIVGRVLWRGNS